MKRYELEHRILPMRFYQDCEAMVQEIETEGTSYFEALYAEAGVPSKDACDVGLLDYEGGVNIIRVFVPKEDEIALCVCLYLIYSKDREAMRYLTVENSPEGGYALLSWDENLNYKHYGEYTGRNERTMIDSIVAELLSEETSADSGQFGEMIELLKREKLSYYEDEIADYIQMFEVIDTLTEQKLTLAERVSAFASLSPFMQDESLINSRQQMKGMYDKLEELPETKGKLDKKGRLYLAFSVYIASNIMSENDDKKHTYMGIPEFESADFIKSKMEEYWGFEPYMFSFAVN